MAVDKRRTLWDRITGANVFVPNEEKVHNPFKAKIGSSFHLDLLDYRGVFYTLQQLDVVDCGTGVLMADYHLDSGASQSGKNIADNKRNLILRSVPRDGTTASGKINFRIVALSLYFQCGHDDESYTGIMEGVNDPAGEFVINAGTTDEKRYWRLYGLKTSETANVTTVKDTDGDVGLKRIEMWGFSRTTEDEAKQEVNEYLYVQKDSSNGWMEIFIGQEIPPERINV